MVGQPPSKTTDEHSFWNVSDGRWTEAGNLEHGERLRTPNGDRATVVGVRSFDGDGSMYNLTVEGPHTYYVVAGEAAVLVHNASCGDPFEFMPGDSAEAKRHNDLVKARFDHTYGPKAAKWFGFQPIPPERVAVIPPARLKELRPQWEALIRYVGRSGSSGKWQVRGEEGVVKTEFHLAPPRGQLQWFVVHLYDEGLPGHCLHTQLRSARRHETKAGVAVIEWPEGFCLSIGMWFDRIDAPSALLAVADVLVAEGGRYTGALLTGPVEEPFTWVDLLEGKEYVEGLTAEQVRSGLSDGTGLRLSMHLPGAGAAMVELGGTPEELPATGHPVQVTVSAGTLMFVEVENQSDEPTDDDVLRSALLRYLTALCTALDPAYAHVVMEDATTPVPGALASGGRSVGADAFISQRFADDPSLGSQLAEAARYCDTLELKTGTFYSSWVINDVPRERALYVAMSAASVTLGTLLTTGDGAG